MWYLCRTSTQESWESLTLSEIFQKVSAFESPWTEFFLWFEGSPQWVPLVQVQEVFHFCQEAATKKRAKLTLTPPPLPKSSMPPLPGPASGSASQATSTASSEKKTPTLPGKSKSPEAETRRFPRYQNRLRVILRSKEITFRTFTRNISAGGVALEHDVPSALLDQDCQMYLSDPQTQANIKFSARVVANRSESKYFLFTNLNENESKRFADWLAKFLHQASAA
ncbi:MAG: PilZ domain-containing protein [Bdellovibrio sp.]